MRCQEIDFQITWGIEWISTPQATERQEVHMVTEMSFYVLLFWFSITLSASSKEVADKVIEKKNQKINNQQK